MLYVNNVNSRNVFFPVFQLSNQNLLVIFIMNVWKASLLGISLHFVPVMSDQAVGRIYGVVASTL